MAPRPSSRYDALVDVATELFGANGFERTTVRMIADRLGVKSGSLYSHISSKDEILTKVVLAVADEFLAGAEQAREGAGTAEERLRAMCRAHLEVLHRRQAAVTVYYDEWRRLEGDHRRTILELRRAYERHFADVIREGIASGELREVDVSAAVLVILSACNWTYQWYSTAGQHGPQELADLYLDVILGGLRAAPTR